MRLVNIGLGNYIAAHRVHAITTTDSAATKQLITNARKVRQLIDATYGRRTRSVVIIDSGHVLLSSLQPATVAARCS